MGTTWSLSVWILHFGSLHQQGFNLVLNCCSKSVATWPLWCTDWCSWLWRLGLELIQIIFYCKAIFVRNKNNGLYLFLLLFAFLFLFYFLIWNLELRFVSLLLSFLPPSCMVVPIRELVNTLFSTSTTTIQSLQMACLPSTMDMNIDIDIIRERSASSSRINSRESLIDSKASSMAYHERMEVINNLLNDNV